MHSTHATSPTIGAQLSFGAGLWFLIGCFALAWTQPALRGESLRSVSGQFLISWSSDRFYTPELTPAERNEGLIALTPELVSLTAEQVKSQILQVLELGDHWKQNIRITLRSSLVEQEPLVLLPTRFADGWGFRLLLYPKLKEAQWIRSLVQIMLLDLINRPSPERMCSPPSWLVDGLWQEMLQTAITNPSMSLDDILAPGQLNTSDERFRSYVLNSDSTSLARAYLKTVQPIALEDLLLSDDSGLNDLRLRHSSHLLFHGLGLTPEGVAGIQRFIGGMSGYLNWQSAFHLAFAQSYPNMLQLEKAWALQIAALSQYNPRRRADMQRSLEVIEEVLTPQAKVALRENELPVYERFSLETVLQRWPSQARDNQVRQMLERLRELKQWTVFECGPLIDDYIELLQGFLEQVPQIGLDPVRKGELPLREGVLVSRTIRRLVQIEKRRQLMANQFRELDRQASTVNLGS